jgi:hypothetical protein
LALLLLFVLLRRALLLFEALRQVLLLRRALLLFVLLLRPVLPLRLALLLFVLQLRPVLLLRLTLLPLFLLLRRALLLLVLLLLLEALRLALLLLFMLLRRALMLLKAPRPVLPLRLSLLLFVATCHGLAPRAARVIVFRLQRRARVVCRRRTLHCHIERRATRRARGVLCHRFVLPRAACEIFVLFRQRARAACRRGLLWDRSVAPARRCFARRRCRGRCPGPTPRFACGNPLRLTLLLLFLLLRRALLNLVLLPRLSLLLFVVPCHGPMHRAARVVVFRLQRRSRIVCRRRPLHCRIVRRNTRRARGFLCHGPVFPRAACEVFVLFRRRARADCRRGLLWDRPVAPARRCFARRRCRGRCPGPAPRSACGNPLSLWSCRCLRLLLP